MFDMIRTLLLVNPQHNNNLVPANSDQLLDGSDTSSRQLGQQNHAINVVVFEKLDIGAHFGNLSVTPVSSCPLVLLSNAILPFLVLLIS